MTSTNSFDLSSMGPISSQMMTSEVIGALMSSSAAKRHPDMLTKYFPTLGPFPVMEAKKISLPFVARSINSNPVLTLFVLIYLETILLHSLVFPLISEQHSLLLLPSPPLKLQLELELSLLSII